MAGIGQEAALLSVSDKTGIVELGQGLVELGWPIYSSGGTAKALREGDIDAIDIQEIVGPAILGDRVKTLSRQLHGGLLARAEVEADIHDLEAMGVPYLGLVAVDMYPLRKTIESGASEADVIENTDVGGPTMLHSAAKGRRITLSRPEQRPVVLEWMRQGQPDKENVLRFLAATAEYEVASYIKASADYIGRVALRNELPSTTNDYSSLCHSMLKAKDGSD